MNRFVKILSLLLSVMFSLSLFACSKDTQRLESIETVSLYWPVGVPLPEASEFVPELPEDVTVRYAQRYTFSDVGVYTLSLILSDETGAEIERSVQFSLLVDTTPPVIQGVREISAYIGKPVSYKSGITVVDNCSGKLTLSVDASDVDLSKVGTYRVIYTATDAAGNTSVVKTNLYVYDFEVTLDMLNEKLDPILAEIIKPTMTKVEQCRAIYSFVYDHVKYVSTSEKADWIRSAYQGLDEGQGDCFTYYALSKAFFERLGIPNMCIQRTAAASEAMGETHYWNYVNVGDAQTPQWYHFDTTHLRDAQYTGKFWLITEEQLKYYNLVIRNDNGHFYDYDHTGYPKPSNEIINGAIKIS